MVYTHPDVIADVLEGSLGKALLRRFADATEAVRDGSIRLFGAALDYAPDAAMSLMPYLMPVLEERLIPLDVVTTTTTTTNNSSSPSDATATASRVHRGSGTTASPTGHPHQGTAPEAIHLEPAEDVRLALYRLAWRVILILETGCQAYASELVEMVRVGLEDAYHEVAEAACRVCRALVAALGKRLHAVSKQLVAMLLPTTTHRRQKTRIAAIEALQDAMFCGGHEMILQMIAWQDPHQVAIKAFYEGEVKVNFCGKLALDPVPTVRLAFCHMVGTWITTLDERKDHEERLMPYLLSAVTDSSPAVAETALDYVDRLGALYEKDKQEDLKDRLYYLDQVRNVYPTPPHPRTPVTLLITLLVTFLVTLTLTRPPMGTVGCPCTLLRVSSRVRSPTRLWVGLGWVPGWPCKNPSTACTTRSARN